MPLRRDLNSVNAVRNTAKDSFSWTKVACKQSTYRDFDGKFVSCVLLEGGLN